VTVDLFDPGQVQQAVRGHDAVANLFRTEAESPEPVGAEVEKCAGGNVEESAE